MSSGNYYGNGGDDNGYGGYRQQPYPSQRYTGGDDYDGIAPPASYGEALQQQQQQRPDYRSSSPYSQSSGPGYGHNAPGPMSYRPPPGPPAPSGYEGYRTQGAPQQQHQRPGKDDGRAAASHMPEEHNGQHEQQRQQQQQQKQQFKNRPLYSQHPNKGNFEGNFSASSGQISLDSDFDLIASCGALDGGLRLSSIKLNDCLTNEWGHFKWLRGGNFAASARSVKLVDDGHVLEAELADGNGGWNRSYVFLDEKITNDNGELKLLD